MLREFLTNIANAIRAALGATDRINAQDFPDKINEVYEAGKKSEYDAFWDNYQQNGNRVGYTTAFGGCWNKGNFKPKYSMRPTNAYMMFFNNTGAVIDLGEVAEDYFDNLGIELDFSEAKNMTYGIATLHAKRFKKIDISSASSTMQLFYSHNNVVNNNNSVEEIDEFVSSEITTYENSTFQHAIWLREIRFTGVIATGVFNIQWSPNLSHDSLMSIINVLADKTGDTSKTWTATLGATNLAKLTIEEQKIAYNKGWDLG